MVAFRTISNVRTIVFPVHPRTRAKLDSFKLEFQVKNLRFIPPVSFLDMVQLEKHARCILTDSGGVQKEAYFHCVPCVTLRDETEWVETVAAGWNQVVGSDAERIVAAVSHAALGQPIAEYGVGHSSEIILNILAGSK
jgi:UDP-GlcNAc3NAcA epimerase